MARSSRSYPARRITASLAPPVLSLPEVSSLHILSLDQDLGRHGIAATPSRSCRDHDVCFAKKWDSQKFVALPLISESLPTNSSHKDKIIPIHRIIES